MELSGRGELVKAAGQLLPARGTLATTTTFYEGSNATECVWWLRPSTAPSDVVGKHHGN
jgi:hypothetical protein